MAHRTLYRMFRPTVFDDVRGQEQVTEVLKKEIENETPGHAFLFCGSRGTGKTTTARILANALNCLHPVDGNPCGTCEVCRLFADDRFVDIVEIDAASNNGVDNIRDLREKAALLPVQGKYKVYIIDEVHMLSSGAFNALLKTLEEPPAHTVFILATTELRKVPKTIVSRCQRFEFRRISKAEIEKRLRFVAAKIGVEAEDEALGIIAGQADGALRDALSLFEQCAAGRTRLTGDDVLENLGISDSAVLANLCEEMLAGDTAGAFSSLTLLIDNGTSYVQILQDMVVHLSEQLARAAQQQRDVKGLLRALDILIASQATLRYSPVPQAVLLTALVRASTPSTDLDLTNVQLRLERLEDQMEELKKRPPAVPRPAASNAPPTKAVPKPQERKEQPVQEKNADVHDAGSGALQTFWQCMEEINPPLASCARKIVSIAREGNTAILRAEEEEKAAAELLLRDGMRDVLQAVASALGVAVPSVRLELVESAKKKSQYAVVIKELVGAFGKENVIVKDD